MARIVIISDTHGLQDYMDPIPDGDILIHAGDLTRNGTLAELTSLNLFLALLPHQHKIVIAGNHDFCFEQDKENARKALSGVKYLQDQTTRIMGFKIYGSPWQPRFGDFAFNLDRGEEIRKVWSNIPEDTDILVTHGPPMGILDLPLGENEGAGCKDLLDAVLKIQPKLHAFGHIHYGYGSLVRGKTTFVNASTCNEAYQPINAPVVVDIE